MTGRYFPRRHRADWRLTCAQPEPVNPRATLVFLSSTPWAFPYPKGVAPRSPGLVRGTSAYPGNLAENSRNPNGRDLLGIDN